MYYVKSLPEPMADAWANLAKKPMSDADGGNWCPSLKTGSAYNEIVNTKLQDAGNSFDLEIENKLILMIFI